MDRKTNQNQLRQLLKFCLASLAVALVVAVVTGALSQDEEGTGETPERVSARVVTEPTITDDTAVPDPIQRNLLDEYSIDIVNQDGLKIGTARVQSTSQGVEFNIFARKLSPGPYAIHLHEKGACKGPDFASAGGHFNPTNATHGVPDYDTDPGEQDHHIGDMRGDHANSQGQLNHRATNASVTLGPTIGGRYSIADEDGTSLVLTYGDDTGSPQDSEHGNPRMACGVITEPRVEL